jgi:hypothetical protein
MSTFLTPSEALAGRQARDSAQQRVDYLRTRLLELLAPGGRGISGPEAKATSLELSPANRVLLTLQKGITK